jgi:hypothetical protein
MAYSTINKSTDYFRTKLYTGNGSARSITFDESTNMQPDLMWVKGRTTTASWLSNDAVRGATKRLKLDQNSAESTETGMITSFNTNGFSLGTTSTSNANGENYASWNWKAGGGQGSSNTDGSINTTYTSVNTTAGFSISSYTGNGTSGATVGHGLGAVPKMIIIKQTSSNGGTENWVVYHASLGNTKRLSLNLTEDISTDSAVWNNTTPTSSVFSLGNSDKSNNNTVSYIAYCFAEKAGYSKFGSYTGNGSTDGTFIYTGFKPSFVLQKSTAVQGWQLQDNKRNGFNGANKLLQPNDTAAESDVNRIDMLSNGFKVRTTDAGQNSSGQSYIFMAFGQSIVGSNNIPATAR